MNTREYELFPEDDIWYMREIVSHESRNIPKTEIDLADVIPAIPTLYMQDWTIDYDELEIMIKTQAHAWISSVLIAWTTWESSSLSHSEHIEYVQQAVEIAKIYNVQVLAWSWSNYTKEQNDVTKWVFEAWADACLLLPPYYIKASDTDIVRHLTSWLNKWPAIIYSISWRTWVQINNDVIEALSTHPNFLWVKECDWADKIKELTNRSIRVWTWNDDTSHSDIHESWACWTISVVCDIDPNLMLEVTHCVNLTNTAYQRVMDLSHLMFLPWQPNPKPVHNAIEIIRRAIRWIEKPAIFRLPVWPLNIEQQKYLWKWLSDLKIRSRPFNDNFKLIS